MSLAQKRFVSHPRYGDRPRYTGLNFERYSSGVHLHWHCRDATPEQLNCIQVGAFPTQMLAEGFSAAIPNTGVVADVSLQHSSCMPVTHYFDIATVCVDCRSPFIFYAEEQKHWYEELSFPIDADCVRCYPCRRATQDIDRTVCSYEDLMSVQDPSPDQQADLAARRLTLVQAGRFHTRQLEHVRAFLNRFPDHPKSADIRSRLAAIA